MTRYTLNAAAVALLSLHTLPSVLAHMAPWGPYVYEQGLGHENHWPLNSKLSYEEWTGDKPKESLSLKAGGSVTLDIGCRPNASGYGGNTGEEACPMDPGAYHAGAKTCPEGQKDCQLGWSANKEEQLMGCAIAIAYKPTAAETNPEDFTVMSVQPSCVRRRLTSFELPENLPACPEGGCTCAWFWSGYESDNEMYMTGFRCDVEGGVITDDYPVSKEPLKGTLQDGPVQPFYWATTLNNIGYTVAAWDLDAKPKYNEAYGWKTGAQTHAFAGVAAGGNSSQNVDPVANAVVPPAESGSASDVEVVPSATMESEPEVTSVAAEGPGAPAETMTDAGMPEATAPAALPSGLDNDAAVPAPGPGGESMSMNNGSGNTADANMSESTADPASPAPTGYAPPKDANADPAAGNSKPAGCTGHGGRGGRHSRTGGKWGADQAQQTGDAMARRSRWRAAH